MSHLVAKVRHRRDLLGRFKLMNQAHLGMSVHANAAKDAGEPGAIVFYERPLWGQIYAQLVLEELEKVQVLNEAAPIPCSTLLLLKARPPVVLVEIGFMSNPTDLAVGRSPVPHRCGPCPLPGILNYWEWASGEQSETSLSSFTSLATTKWRSARTSRGIVYIHELRYDQLGRTWPAKSGGYVVNAATWAMAAASISAHIAPERTPGSPVFPPWRPQRRLQIPPVLDGPG